jgi:DNA-binding transcriptional regulator/RsmH inhibitor MraZ
MFFGRWPYMVDDRGRVPIPSVFRKSFKEHILTITDGHLRLYPEKKIFLSFEDIYIVDVHEGRILIPIQLRKKVPEVLSKHVEWKGMGDYLELNIIKEEAII